MIIRSIMVKGDFKYLWLKSVEDVDLSKHCARCLSGVYDDRVNAKLKEAHDLELDGDVYYLCGVSRPYKWENNFHLAFRRKNSSNIECSDNGVSVVIEGAERLPIDDKYNNPSDSHYRTESYSTCRNWQFANYFETHLKRGMGNATETIAH